MVMPVGGSTIGAALEEVSSSRLLASRGWPTSSGADMRNLLAIIVVASLASGCGVIGHDRDPMAEDDGSITWTRNSSFNTGPRMEVFLEVEPGRLESVNSLDDAIATRPAETPIPGHQARDWTFLKETEHGTSIVFAVTSWDPANPADYIMAGWWAEFIGQYLPDLDLNEAARLGIVDGLEIDARFPPDLPVEGQAGYLGQTGGLYRYLSPGGGKENILTEKYQGTIDLTADFTDMTVQGCVGGLVSRREHFNFFLGDEQRFDASPFIKDFEIHLGAVPFEENGAFRSRDVEVMHPTLAADEQGKTSGFWGGSMSSIPDADGNPWLASGFTVGVFKGEDGSRASFVGSFLALSDTRKGFMRVYVNGGTKPAYSWSGITRHPKRGDTFFKFGICRPLLGAEAPSQIVYYDDVRSSRACEEVTAYFDCTEVTKTEKEII